MMLMALRLRPPTIPPALRPAEAAARKVLLRLHPTEEAEQCRHRVQIEAGSFFLRVLLFGRHVGSMPSRRPIASTPPPAALEFTLSADNYRLMEEVCFGAKRKCVVDVSS
ncbi:uncharacterized protein [Triticum aestivum]|nr:uncharacterized protein LOC123112850 isoform X2 [Triticum aestivum]